MVNDLINILNKNHHYTIGYADDIVILTSGMHAGIVCDITRSALAILERWYLDNELSINLRKTEIVMFTKKRNLKIYPPPRLFNLEAIFNHKLNRIARFNNNTPGTNVRQQANF